MGKRHLSHFVPAAAGAALFLAMTAGPGLAFGPGMIGDGALRGLKVSENNSPRPTDRFYFHFEYFHPAAFPAVPNGVFREIVGFEKTFLDTNASIEVRLPFVQTVDPVTTTFDIGDPSIILKYAFINDAATGDVLSGGLGVSLPVTGGSIEIQPFVGGYWTPSPGSPFFIQGFTSALIPIEFPDASFITGDVGVGYIIQVGGPILQSVTPMIELHINTPVSAIDDSDLAVGIGAAYDLGGATIGTGIGATFNGDTYADVGVNFSF